MAGILKRSCLPLLLALLSSPGIASRACGRQPDEYLQSTRVIIEPSQMRLQVDLTPGVEIAKLVIDLIDRDTDGVMSAGEIEAYAGMFSRDLAVLLDRREVDLKYIPSAMPDAVELRAGTGIIRLEYSVMHSMPEAGAHELSVENRHLPILGKYLITAATPESGEIRIDSQDRNMNQSEGTIKFTYAPPAKPAERSFTGYVFAGIGVLLLAGGVWIWWSGRWPAVARWLIRQWRQSQR